MTQKPRSFKHALWLLYFPFYFALFALAEKLVVTDYWVSYCKLDDYIPFVKEFVIPYVLWYPYLAWIGLWLLFKDPDGFKRYIWFIAIGFTSTVIFCMIFPNGQDLRVEHTQNDICSQLIRQLHNIDTNTNVFPSMHVIGAIGVMIAAFDTCTLKGKFWIHFCNTVLGIAIILSTVFIKQHSILDIFGAIGFSVILFLIVYVWLKKLQNKHKTFDTGEAGST